MDFETLCRLRRSARGYQPTRVERAKLDYILRCARLAPSAVNRQPWRFHIVDDTARLGLLARAYDRPWFATAPAVIAAVALHAESWHRPADGKDHADIDLGIATEHLCLAAAEQGLGTCWVCNFDTGAVARLLGLAPGEEPVALIPVGYAADEPRQSPRKEATETLRWPENDGHR